MGDVGVEDRRQRVAVGVGVVGSTPGAACTSAVSWGVL